MGLKSFVMDPLSENDPVYKLLGKARSVEPRPNFTQNVLRAIRQQPQSRTAWERFKDKLAGLTFPRPAYTAGAFASIAIAAFLTITLLPKTEQNNVYTNVTPSISTSEVATTSIPEVETSTLENGVTSELDNIDQLSVLLAQQDTSSLTDNEIALLLY